MNPLYEQIFNQRYVQPEYYNQLRLQEYQAQQHHEIEKAVKALHDYCDAARKIAPEYHSIALQKCIEAILLEISKG